MSGERAAVTAGADGSQIGEELRRFLAKLSDGKLAFEDIDPSGHLFDFGYVDSLSAVTFMAHVEERFGIRLDDLDLVERFTSLDALARHICENRA
jgi:acyl carrier protein